MFNELEHLSNPKSFTNQIKISDFNKRELITFLRKMLLIRMVENKVAKLIKKDYKLPFSFMYRPEAISVGILDPSL